MTCKLYALGFILLQCSLASGLSLSASANPTFSNAGDSTAIAANRAELSPLVFNQSNTPSSFERGTRPSRRTSGGSRSGCSDQLVALLPGSDTIATAEAGSAVCVSASIAQQTTTLAASPTLWFYVPAQSQTGVQAELVLLDDNAQALSIDAIELPAESGIVGVQFSQPLAAGQTYQWVFSILTHPGAPSENPTVEGRLQRISPEPVLSSALDAADEPQARAQLLAEQGIWHDALDTVAQMRNASSDDALTRANWVSLLDSVGLGAIAQADLVN